MIESTLAQAAAAVAAATGQPAPVATPIAGTPPAGTPVAGPPPVAVATPPTPAAITLSPEQWAAYTASQTRIAELEAAERQRIAAAGAAEVEALQTKGRITDAFNLQRTQYEATLADERKKIGDTENRMRRYALDGELARALASHPLVAGGALQLTKLLRDEFTVEGRGDSIVVQSKDFRTVAAFIDAIVPTVYPHFLTARNPQGGTAGAASTQSSPTAPATTTVESVPQTLMEAIIHRQQNTPAATFDPRTNLAKPFGLFGTVPKTG